MIFSIYFLLFIWYRLAASKSIIFCDPSYCISGCCRSITSCLVFTSSSFKSEMKNCYKGDCSIMKCGSEMCCSNGKCYDLDNNACNPSLSTETIIFTIVVPIILVLILCFIIILYLAHRKKACINRHFVPPPINENPNNVNQPQINLSYRNYNQQMTIPQNCNYQQEIPINNVILPEGQPYFPNEENHPGEYAIHESQMGGQNMNKLKILGQPPPQNYNIEGYQYQPQIPQNNNNKNS